MDGAAFAEHRVLGRWFSGLVGGGRTRLSPWPRLDDEGKRRAVRMPSLLRAHEVVHGTKLATNFSRIGRRARPQNSGPAIEGCSNPVRFTASLSKRFPQRALYFSQVSAIRRAMARSPTLGMRPWLQMTCFAPICTSLAVFIHAIGSARRNQS